MFVVAAYGLVSNAGVRFVPFRQRKPIGNVAVFVTATLRLTFAPTATVWLCGWTRIAGRVSTVSRATWLVTAP